MVEPLGAGLCDTCRWQRLVLGVNTVFSMCTRALTDPGFRKYPPLPVWRCSGFQDVTTSDEPDTPAS